MTCLWTTTSFLCHLNFGVTFHTIHILKSFMVYGMMNQWLLCHASTWFHDNCRGTKLPLGMCMYSCLLFWKCLYCMQATWLQEAMCTVLELFFWNYWQEGSQLTKPDPARSRAWWIGPVQNWMIRESCCK